MLLFFFVLFPLFLTLCVPPTLSLHFPMLHPACLSLSPPSPPLCHLISRINGFISIVSPWWWIMSLIIISPGWQIMSLIRAFFSGLKQHVKESKPTRWWLAINTTSDTHTHTCKLWCISYIWLSHNAVVMTHLKLCTFVQSCYVPRTYWLLSTFDADPTSPFRYRSKTFKYFLLFRGLCSLVGGMCSLSAS